MNAWKKRTRSDGHNGKGSGKNFPGKDHTCLVQVCALRAFLLFSLRNLF
jgi:hypothetical protein